MKSLAPSSNKVKWVTPIYHGWWFNGEYFSSRRLVCVNCKYESGPEAKVEWIKKEGMSEKEFEKIKKEIIESEAREKPKREFKSWVFWLWLGLIALFTLAIIVFG